MQNMWRGEYLFLRKPDGTCAIHERFIQFIVELKKCNKKSRKKLMKKEKNLKKKGMNWKKRDELAKNILLKNNEEK